VPIYSLFRMVLARTHFDNVSSQHILFCGWYVHSANLSSPYNIAVLSFVLFFLFFFMFLITMFCNNILGQ